ncbi:response regulator [Alteromonas sp. ASW11-130]|uniref:response regulator n=1 Tax=Alteromonas sp. ASW11-130 TaxID=3015775 RepID=UPI002242A734|nr:response regulator [Alteromonas sp. ASW11-130]MCW8090237.1 response regulator [Alteromonas sp. ASW11-130]
MLEKFPSPPSFNDLNVLIIDNQSLVHEIIKPALIDIGIKKVSSAMNAFHALRLCEQQQFDIILLAFNVSHDKDGFHLFEELKHKGFITDKATVVFLSAETSQELVNCIFELQPDDFWVKPLARNRVERRLTHLLSVRAKLNKVYHCLSERDFSAAIYQAERQLLDTSLSEYHPKLKRTIGECLFQLYQYHDAEQYFSTLLEEQDQGWMHIGLARAMLKQDKAEEAASLIENLLVRQDTRFQMYDLLAQHYIEKVQFDAAYKQMKQASLLAPRNINRNKKVWDLARLNRDKEGQLAAVKNMAKFARNSIHDSPELQINVIRSSIDLATTQSGEEAQKTLQKLESVLHEIKQQKGLMLQLGTQLTIIEARLLCLKDDKCGAESIMKMQKPSIENLSMEDCLDKMKAFHEIGMKEHCLKLLDDLRTKIEGDTFSSQVLNEYLKQESIERKEINFTTKELKKMAATNYKENRIAPAYNNLKQALTLAPGDKQIALSLLKVLVQLNFKEPLSLEQLEVAKKTGLLLMGGSLPATQLQKCNQYLKALGISFEAKNDDMASPTKAVV